MVFVLATVVSLVIAFLRGRSPEDILHRPFRILHLAIVGVVLHVVVSLSWFARVLAIHPGDLGLPLGSLLYLASFACLIVFLLANVGQPGFPVFLVGLVLNVIAIATNGGQMPGDPRQLAAAGVLDHEREMLASGLWLPFTIMEPSTHFSWLGDRIFIPLLFGHNVVLSVGDLVICIGCFFFCNAPFRRSSMFSARRPRFGVG